MTPAKNHVIDPLPASIFPAQLESLIQELREVKRQLREAIEGRYKLPPGVRVVFVNEKGEETLTW